MDQLIRDSRSFMRWYGRNIPIILLALFSVDCLFLPFKQVYSLIVYIPVFALVIGVGYKKKNRIEEQMEEVCTDFDRRLDRSEEGDSSVDHDSAILPTAEVKNHLDELVKQTTHFCKSFGLSIPGVLLGLLGAASLIGHLDGAYIAGAFSITFIMAFFLSRNLTRIQNQVLQDFSRLESENLSCL